MDIFGQSMERLGARLTRKRTARMFGRNTVASTITFLLDLGILWLLVELVSVPQLIAAVIAFAIAMILFYILSRCWVFPDSGRNAGSGFAYFLFNIGIGFLVMFAVFWALLQWTELFYLLARIIASIVSGVVIFLLNGIFNFKQI